MARLAVPSPWHLKAFQRFNAAEPYANQITPFNFMLAAHLADQGRPAGIARGDPFRLVAPFETNPQQWTRMP